ncbi:hypothetical protein Sjap_008177 [Stephania japonica]|uniref:Uncharacterized protein n=1 Tax=Stephania japonica TaxID=461633 RepID=A0AAP0JQK1_9MAGN
MSLPFNQRKDSISISLDNNDSIRTQNDHTTASREPRGYGPTSIGYQHGMERSGERLTRCRAEYQQTKQREDRQLSLNQRRVTTLDCRKMFERMLQAEKGFPIRLTYKKKK